LNEIRAALQATRFHGLTSCAPGRVPEGILSAGWGLIKASFLTPMYDITFKYMPKKEERYKRRGKKDIYNDLLALPEHTDEPIVFLGGKDYIPMFCSLTSAIMAEKTVIYNSDVLPNTPECSSVRYKQEQERTGTMSVQTP
jgi:hypothetical protein